MASIIDALLVTIGLDATGYKRGQKEVEEANRKLSDEEQKQAKEQQARQKAAVEGFRAIRNEILTIVSAALGGKALKDFMADATATNRQLGINARNLGMSASRLKAWQDAAKAAGGTAEGLTSSMEGLAQAITRHNNAEPNAATSMLARMGVNFDEKDAQKLMLDISEGLKKVGERYGPQQQIYVANGLGIDAGTLQLMTQGRARVADLVNEMAKHTQSADEAEKQARKLSLTWAELSNRADDLGNRVFSTLAPAFRLVTDLMRTALDLILALDKASGGWVVGIGTTVAALGGLVLALAGVAKTLKIIREAAEALRAMKGVPPVAPGGAPAGAPGGAAAGGGWFSAMMTRLAPFFRWGVAFSALTYSGSLNANEDAELAKLRGQASPDASKRFAELESKWGLPAGMLDKIWAIESNRGQNMVSPAGATGHFQFMPGTAKQYGLSREDTFDLNKSSEGAARYLADLLKKYSGNTEKALAAYNWGMGNVDRQGLANAPLETINYIKKYNNLGGRAGNTTTSETHIQSLTINTQATDAQGIARELPSALGANSLVPNFATGVN